MRAAMAPTIIPVQATLRDDLLTIQMLPLYFLVAG